MDVSPNNDGMKGGDVLQLELGSNERQREAKDEECGKADSDGDLAGGTGGEGNCFVAK